MTTRERAYSIIDQFNERELQGFIALFSRAYPPKNNDMSERRVAYERIKEMCRPIPELDEKKELEEYREERYGTIDNMSI
ncbi:MAG: hypothetical protein K6G50_07440 [bacterium]|nr:hypothetical protein [bacterium]